MDRNLESDGGGSAAADAHEWRSAWADRISGKESSSRSGLPTTAHSQFHRAQRMSLKRRRGRLERRVLSSLAVLLPGLFGFSYPRHVRYTNKISETNRISGHPGYEYPVDWRWMGKKRGGKSEMFGVGEVDNYLTNHAE